jgi:hypothetical protein
MLWVTGRPTRWVSAATKGVAVSDLNLPNAPRRPARPNVLTVEFYEQADALMIRKRRGGGPWAFLLHWRVGWTVGCVFLLVNTFKDPSIGNLAFGLPFWASWLLVAGTLIWMLFGRETLFLGADEAVFERKAFVRFSSRVVPREEIQVFRECRSAHTDNDERLLGIEMLTLGKSLRFAFRLPDGERAWLIDQLNQFLTTSSPHREVPGSQAAPSLQESKGNASPERTLGPTEVLSYERTLAAPPTDCSWRLADDSVAYVLWQQGRVNVGQLAGLLFVNLFWNGIFSVFVMFLFGLMPLNNAPVGWEWWGLLVFLIPFEVVGLAMFAGLILMVLEPWRRTSWQFGEESIVRQSRWPFFRWTRSWIMPRLDRLELRRLNPSGRHSQRFSESIGDPTGTLSFALALISSDNVDVCEIKSLTEGEARWMARIILKRRSRWFGGLETP